VPIESTSVHSMLDRTFDGQRQWTLLSEGRRDVRDKSGEEEREREREREREKERERRKGESKGFGPRESAMRLVIYHGRPGARSLAPVIVTC